MPEGTMNLLWDYYKKAAEVFGRVTKVDEETGEVREKQANYSLLWFYLDGEERRGLNDLTRAFLGDEDARGRLRWNERLPETVDEYFLEDKKNYPNESQIRAIKAALANPISFIQGPPGTGKTTTILNLVSCIAAMGKTVAIVSGNKNALKTIWKKTDEFAEGEDKPNQRRVKKGLAKLGNKEVRSRFNKEHGLSGEEAFKSESVRYLPDSTVSREIHVEFQPFLRQYPIITSTINSMKCCFKNEERLCYDYVIVDESSQVDTVKGILAMSCAHHLVLVGDEQQLPPVLNREQIGLMELEWAEAGNRLPLREIYGMQEERSFLEVCLDVFRLERPWVKVFLEEHYRCHPGIIEFCNRKEIYDGALKVKTRDYDESVQVPIKILWFEGDYCENCYEAEKEKKGNPEGGGKEENRAEGGSGRENGRRKKGKAEEEIEKSTKRNRKQADIFMTEELPELIRRMGNPEEGISNVCILSPFRGQLKELEKRVNEYNEENSGKIQVLMSDEKAGKGQEKPADGEEEDEEGKTPMLTISPSTIHKSQGDEFDIVYLLPVEDGEWEWPWSQQKRLVNVAVSRAKKELRLIVSSVMMSHELQHKLTGHPIAEEAKLSEGADSDWGKAGKPAKDRDNQMFIQKLADYVWEKGTDSDHKRGFGFHQTRQRSIFDQGHWKKKQGSGLRKNQWAPERCVEDALKEMPFFAENQLELYHNVRILDILDERGQGLDFSGLDEEMIQYLNHGAEFDFVVCKEGRILLAIEVDGMYHRFNYNRQVLEHQKLSDERKDELVKNFFHGACYLGNDRKQEMTEGSFAFLRLPSDGSTCLETRALWAAGKGSEQNRVFPLEELLEKQLEHGAEGSYRFAPVAFKDLIYRYKSIEAPWVERRLGGKNPYQRLREFLVERHYLMLEGNRSVPTKRGGNLGIVMGSRMNARGEIYTTPFYLERAADLIRTQLEAEDGTWERETVEELAERLYHQFEQHVRESERGEGELLIPPDWSKTAAPDYSQIHVQELYLLRYLSAYACEYTQTYEELQQALEKVANPGGPLEVMSIGCGNMVDYWGISEAFTRAGKGRLIHYLGIDKTDWKEICRIGARTGDQVRFRQQDGAAYLREQSRLAAGLIVFPKSISEFPDEVFEDICESFRRKEFARGRICLLTVFRSNGDGPNPWPEDKERCDRLILALEENGFQKKQDDLRAPGEDEKDRLIWDTDRQFAYMQDLYPAAKELFREYGRQMPPDMAKVMTRSPMLHAYICYRVVILERGQDLS